MDKNDFDIDFDFEKEYGFDPEEFLNSDNPGDFDLSQFDEEELAEEISEEEMPAEDFDYDKEEVYEEEPEEDYTAGINFSRRRERTQEDYQAQFAEEEPEYAEDQQMPEYAEDQAYDEDAAADDEAEEESETDKPRKKEKKKLQMPKLPKLPKRKKSDKPSIFSKFVALYFGPLTDKNYGQETGIDETTGRRRRRKSKNQIMKEVYLPPIILCLALLMVLSLAIGSLTNAIKLKRIQDANNKKNEELAAQQADQAEIEFQALMKQAEEMAIGYDYEGAADLLGTYSGEDALHQQEITAKKSEYVNIQSSLQKWEDVNAIANLSFHVLIADPQRAFSDEELGGQYNRNFVTVGEFSKILDQLYSGGYVLVDFDSFVDSAVGLDGNKSFFSKPIQLPQGKKPVMITETMVNYFEYMVDGDKDTEPDAKGDGFANRLVVTQSGDIKAQIVDANGQTQVGNYDLVPVLEDFIKEHPDFSYRGARATLAVTGTQGVFGYRTNTAYISSKSQEFYEQECAEARVLVDALRAKGYTIASYTYNNEAYRGQSVAQIKTDIQNWNNQITPVLGEVDVMVFARASDIDDYSGNKFNVLYDAGFRYFVGNATAPKADVNSTFVRQSRLMVTGNAMGWSPSTFTNYFDCNAVLDMSSRGNIPN